MMFKRRTIVVMLLLCICALYFSLNTSQIFKIAIQKRQNATAENPMLAHQHGIQKLESQQQGPQRRLPTALIIGVKKCGTGTLLEFIRWHPDVRAPQREVNFFDNNYNKGLDWYRSKMPATIDGQITLEKTPAYFFTKGVPKLIHKMNPKMKLILIVRDPTIRAVSDYTHEVAKNRTKGSFEELAFVNGNYLTVNTTWLTIEIGVSSNINPLILFFKLFFHFRCTLNS
jgi:hypothetical protein